MKNLKEFVKKNVKDFFEVNKPVSTAKEKEPDTSSTDNAPIVSAPITGPDTSSTDNAPIVSAPITEPEVIVVNINDYSDPSELQKFIESSIKNGKKVQVVSEEKNLASAYHKALEHLIDISNSLRAEEVTEEMISLVLETSKAIENLRISEKAMKLIELNKELEEATSLKDYGKVSRIAAEINKIETAIKEGEADGK